MKSWSLIAALAAACFGFAAAVTATPLQAAAPRCPFCQERLKICLEDADTQARKQACRDQFARCTASVCP